jgi:AsmA protein
MKKPLKILALLALTLLAIFAALALVLVLVFDPNQYKGEIIEAVKHKTGRDLKIEGKLSWSFFPWLGVQAKGLELSNAPGFGRDPFAKVGAAGVSVELLPLLSRRLHVDTLYVHDLALNLARASSGKTNWDDLIGGAKPSEPSTPRAATPLAAVTLGGLDIRRATITWRDLGSGAQYAARNLELKTGKLERGAPVDLRLAFDLEHAPKRSARFALKTRLLATDDRLQFKNLDAKLDDSRLSGSLEIRNFAKPAYRFDLALDQLDLDRYLAGTPEKPAAAAKNAKDAAPAPPVAIPLSVLRTLDVQGKIRLQKLKAFGLHSSDIAVQISARNGLLALGPNTAKLYGGAYRGRTVLDARPARPAFTFEEQLSQVQLGPFLKDAGVFDKYSGTGDVSLKLTAQGAGDRELKQSLNGNATVALRDGKIKGVNLQKIIREARQAYDAARGKPVRAATSPTDETAFSRLTATIRVTNGVARNDDLKLEGPVVRATGAGTADLVREALDYRLKVTLAEEAGRKGTTVPVRVGGTFAKPEYNVDFGEVVKQKAEEKLEKKLEQKFEKLFKKR